MSSGNTGNKEEDNEPRQSLPSVTEESPGASNTSSKQNMVRKCRAKPHQKTLALADSFLENFNSETSDRGQRKLKRTLSERRPLGALYDENGMHIVSGTDLCDCLVKECEGCFFPCTNCGSQKCGIECRIYRKFMYEQLQYEGCGTVIRNPLHKK